MTKRYPLRGPFAAAFLRSAHFQRIALRFFSRRTAADWTAASSSQNPRAAAVRVVTAFPDTSTIRTSPISMATAWPSRSRLDYVFLSYTETLSPASISLGRRNHEKTIGLRQCRDGRPSLARQRFHFRHTRRATHARRARSALSRIFPSTASANRASTSGNARACASANNQSPAPKQFERHHRGTGFPVDRYRLALTHANTAVFPRRSPPHRKKIPRP